MFFICSPAFRNQIVILSWFSIILASLSLHLTILVCLQKVHQIWKIIQSDHVVVRRWRLVFQHVWICCILKQLFWNSISQKSLHLPLATAAATALGQAVQRSVFPVSSAAAASQTASNGNDMSFDMACKSIFFFPLSLLRNCLFVCEPAYFPYPVSSSSLLLNALCGPF